MALFTMICASLRKRKSYAFSIFILLLVITMILNISGTVIFSSHDCLQASLQRSNIGDHLNWMGLDQYDPAKEQELLQHELVDRVEVEDIVQVKAKTITIKEDIAKNNMTFTAYQPALHSYRMLNSAQAAVTLKQGEALVPFALKEEFDCELGDRISFTSEDTAYTFTIKDFFEDPLLGAAMIGMKNIYISQQDMDVLLKLNNAVVIPQKLISTYLSEEGREAGINESFRELNRTVGLESYGLFSYSRTFFENGTLLLSDILSSILIVFSLLLFGIILLVISYILKASMDQDYVMLGILKAQGFTKQQIRMILVLQYAGLSLLGVLCGIIAAAFCIKPAGNLILDTSGLFWEGTLRFDLCLFILFVLMLFVCITCLKMTHQVNQISPVQAISQGHAPIYFSHRWNISLSSLSFLPLSIRLALKQITGSFRQYLMLMMITGALCFSLISLSSLVIYFSENGSQEIFGHAKSDISIYYTNEQIEQMKEAEAYIQDIAQISSSYYRGTDYFNIENTKVHVDIYDTFEGIGVDQCLKGRYPKYDNEIAVTQIIAQTLGKEIGDSVEVDINGKKETYLITGEYQTMNEMGKVFSMLKSGADKLVKQPQFQTRAIILEDGKGSASIVRKLKQKYGEHESMMKFTDDHEDYFSGYDTVKLAIFSGVSLGYVLVVLLTGVIAYLICMVTLQKETVSIGIWKAEGFTNRQLRLQFSFRFIIISLIGCVGGVFMNLAFSDQLMSSMLQGAGLTSYETIYTLFSMGAPIAIIILSAWGAAYLVTRKIKKVKPMDFMNE